MVSPFPSSTVTMIWHTNQKNAFTNVFKTDFLTMKVSKHFKLDVLILTLSIKFHFWDRFIAIRYPLHLVRRDSLVNNPRRNPIDSRRIITYGIGTFIFSLTYCIPYFLEYERALDDNGNWKIHWWINCRQRISIRIWFRWTTRSMRARRRIRLLY